MVTIPIMQPEARRPEPRRRSNRPREESPLPTPPAMTGPGMVVEGPDGVTYAPVGYYPPSASSNRNSPTRPRSSSSLQQTSRHTPPPQFPYQYSHGGRHVSEGMRPSSANNDQRLPLPHEDGWVRGPRSRRSSISSQSRNTDPFEYQTSSAVPPSIPHQYGHGPGLGRRNVSGPADVQYSSVRRSPPVGAYPASPRAPYVAGSSSDPTLTRRRRPEVIEIPDSESGTSSEDEDESDDLGNGVSVEPERSVVPARKPVGGGKKKARK